MKPHDERPLVYVAGPYSHPDPVTNTHEAIATAEILDATGLMTAFPPHVTFLWHFAYAHSVEFWYDYDLAFLARCDALYRMEGESVGADAEVKYAIEHDIPVFYEYEEIIKWARLWVPRTRASMATSTG